MIEILTLSTHPDLWFPTVSLFDAESISFLLVEQLICIRMGDWFSTIMFGGAFVRWNPVSVISPGLVFLGFVIIGLIAVLVLGLAPQ